VGDLDGVWEVERVSGVLPPMVGVRKRIGGDVGSTLMGPVRVRFDVDGTSLRYRSPLAGLVDELTPDENGYAGRAVFRGRELGRFRMRRVATTTKGDGMADTIKDVLTQHIDEAIAMEENVLRMLDSMIETTDDEQIREELRHHKHETEQQADRLRHRLEAHGASASTVRQAGGMVGALMKGVVDMARDEKAGRNARDAYATEHMEIAAYQLLERVAVTANDMETAEIARRNRAEEEAMARKLEQHWDRFAELSLREEGVVS
jgi:ferritin-like metal-binding protein YciE